MESGGGSSVIEFGVLATEVGTFPQLHSWLLITNSAATHRTAYTLTTGQLPSPREGETDRSVSPGNYDMLCSSVEWRGAKAT